MHDLQNYLIDRPQVWRAHWGQQAGTAFYGSISIVIAPRAALPGWIAGSMAITDIRLPVVPAWAHYVAGTAGVAMVLIIGKLIVSWNEAADVKSETERSE